MTHDITDRLSAGVRVALARAGLPEPPDCQWDVPRQSEHGDYATNVAMTLARTAKRAPRQIADLIVANFPATPEVDRLEVAGPGFLNAFLSPEWCASTLREILAAGAAYGHGRTLETERVRLEFVSANPTGPLVIVNARAAAVGDALARLLRAHGAEVTTEYYVNDAGNQFEALARSFEARVRQALGEPATLPENGYPGEYLIDLASEYISTYELGAPEDLERHLRQPEVTSVGTMQHFGRWAVVHMVERQRRVLHEYGVDFDVWSSEQRDVRDPDLPARAIQELEALGFTYEQNGALWFRASAFGDDKDRVLRKRDGELAYFGVDLAFHHLVKFGSAGRVITVIGPDHHGWVARMRAAMQAFAHAPDALEVVMVQLVTLLRDGQPVRMSKRRGDFVLMEELIEEVGRDAARFTFLTRRHDSPLEFDLAIATRHSAENPVYYVQYAHARIRSIWKQVSEQGIAVPPWSEVDLRPLTLVEEQQLIKRLLQYPDMLEAAARAREPHRIAFWLQELAGLFHPYYRAHRVIQDDQATMLARLALCTAVGQVIRNALDLLGVSAPESM